MNVAIPHYIPSFSAHQIMNGGMSSGNTHRRRKVAANNSTTTTSALPARNAAPAGPAAGDAAVVVAKRLPLYYNGDTHNNHPMPSREFRRKKKHQRLSYMQMIVLMFRRLGSPRWLMPFAVSAILTFWWCLMRTEGNHAHHHALHHHQNHVVNSLSSSAAAAATSLSRRQQPLLLAFPTRWLLPSVMAASSSSRHGLHVMPPAGHLPHGPSHESDEEAWGSLVFDWLDEHDWQRYIYPGADHDGHRERRELLMEIDDPDMSHRFYRNDELDYPQSCVRPNWAWNLYHNCNAFHERTIERAHYHDLTVRYLGSGYFRDAWLLSRDQHDQHDQVVMKRMRYDPDHDYDYDKYRQMHIEALILERLTAAPTVANIYGHCAVSTLVESLPQEITSRIVPGDTADYDRGRITEHDFAALPNNKLSFNNLTSLERLNIALDMAESLAESHGFVNGVVTNGDNHPDQFLVGPLGRIKLNDFNNGHILEYDPVAQKYCPYYVCFEGTYKAPEEIRCDWVDEAPDVFAMGNNIYGLLTGLYPYYTEYDHDKVRAMVVAGHPMPFVDDRYRQTLVEGRLVDIMEQCWVHEPAQRVDIFQVVAHLRETKRLHEAAQQQHPHDPTLVGLDNQKHAGASAHDRSHRRHVPQKRTARAPKK